MKHLLMGMGRLTGKDLHASVDLDKDGNSRKDHSFTATEAPQKTSIGRSEK